MMNREERVLNQPRTGCVPLAYVRALCLPVLFVIAGGCASDDFADVTDGMGGDDTVAASPGDSIGMPSPPPPPSGPIHAGAGRGDEMGFAEPEPVASSDADDSSGSGAEADPGPGPVTDPGAGSGAQSGTMTAGSYDDNRNFDAYRTYLSNALDSGLLGILPQVSLGEQITITVLDSVGEPVGDARVVVTAAGDDTRQSQHLLNLTTRADGRVLFLTGVDGGLDEDQFTVTVHPPDGLDPVEQTFGKQQLAWQLTLPSARAVKPTQLDLAFVVDATGSMSDELEYLKVEIDGIAAEIAATFPEVDQQFSLVVYRDAHDAYVTRSYDFTGSLSAFRDTLSLQRAQGGGDYPEAMHLALEEALSLSWRDRDTARVMFLIADAPPHEEHTLHVAQSIFELRDTGVAVYPVAASGVGDEAEFIMRSAAMLTLSQYLFLTDDSGVGLPHAEPAIACYDVQPLDRLMIHMIASELAGKRLDVDPNHIIRSVGQSEDGVCVNGEAPEGDPCDAIKDGVFRSIEPLDCGPTPPGASASLCAWSVRFFDGEFQYFYTDIVETGTYECRDADISAIGPGGFQHSGRYDTGKGILTWDGVEYQRTD